jgi:hypothetical protein
LIPECDALLKPPAHIDCSDNKFCPFQTRSIEYDPSKSSETKQGHLKELHRSMRQAEWKPFIRDNGSENEPFSEPIVQSWQADSQREVPTGRSIVEVTRPFFEINTQKQLQINQKEKSAIGC